MRIDISVELLIKIDEMSQNETGDRVISEKLGCTINTVKKWRGRIMRLKIDGLWLPYCYFLNKYEYFKEYFEK